MRLTPKAESQTDQTPLARDFFQTAQGKLTKAHDFLDNTDDGFDGAFASAIEGTSDFCGKFIGHFLFWTGVRRGRFREFA